MSEQKGGQATFGGVDAPLKWHSPGGKAYLAQRIVALMPPRCINGNKPDPADPGWLHYVEPYAGGLSVLLANDPEGISEVVNDANGDLMDFWGAIMKPSRFAEFLRRVQAIPFAEMAWLASGHLLARGCRCEKPDCINNAVNFFVQCRQSLAGRMKGFTGITRTRTRRGMNNEVSAWLTAVEGLPAVHERLKRVLILNRDALEVIRKEDGPRTLFYLDPPYLHSTRATTGEYAHEMDETRHAELLSALAVLKGRFLLSGYRSDLYDAAAAASGWRRTDIDIANHAAGGASKRRMVECVWRNF